MATPEYTTRCEDQVQVCWCIHISGGVQMEVHFSIMPCEPDRLRLWGTQPSKAPGGHCAWSPLDKPSCSHRRPELPLAGDRRKLHHVVMEVGSSTKTLRLLNEYTVRHPPISKPVLLCAVHACKTWSMMR